MTTRLFGAAQSITTSTVGAIASGATAARSRRRRGLFRRGRGLVRCRRSLLLCRFDRLGHRFGLGLGDRLRAGSATGSGAGSATGSGAGSATGSGAGSVTGSGAGAPSSGAASWTTAEVVSSGGASSAKASRPRHRRYHQGYGQRRPRDDLPFHGHGFSSPASLYLHEGLRRSSVGKGGTVPNGRGTSSSPAPRTRARSHRAAGPPDRQQSRRRSRHCGHATPVVPSSPQEKTLHEGDIIVMPRERTLARLSSGRQP